MIADIKQVGQLGINYEADTFIDLILQSLPESLGGFIMNQEKTLGELMVMLKEAQLEILKGQEVQGASYFDIP